MTLNTHLAKVSILLVTLIFDSSAQGAHPFHISWTEMEWNAQRQVFEVSIKAHSIDIERALTRAKKKKIDLEESNGRAELIDEYLSDHFYLALKTKTEETNSENRGEAAKPEDKNAEQKLSKIKLIGTEFEASWIWFYLELKPTKSPTEDLALVNSILLDEVDKQINTITVRHGKKKSAERTTIKKPYLMLQEDWYSSK